MDSTRLYLMRHGQVEGHEQKRYNGQADVRLTPQGEAQFGLLRVRLEKKPLAAVYTSDLSRCRQGADLIGLSHQLVPVALPELRELHIGAWEGLTWDEIRERHPQQWQERLENLVHYRVPGGESLQEMADRVRSTLNTLLDRHRGEELALVAHGGVNRVILLDAIGAPLSRMFHLEQGFGCLNIIDYWPDGLATVQLLNG